MTIQLTELTVSGIIAKKYTISNDGTFTTNQAANIHKAKAEVKEFQPEDISNYFNKLSSRTNTCVVLGVCGDPGEEFDLVTADKQEAGTIARTVEFFKYANSGNISLQMLDFDGKHSAEVRDNFLNELDIILADALIGESGSQRKSICRWSRPSTSASAQVNGVIGNGLHVYIAVKKAKAELIPLIHKWCWLQIYGRGYRMTKAAVILSESLIDPNTGGAERVVYSADAVADGEGAEAFYKHIDRDCAYRPGGVIDGEVALQILTELTLDFDREWALYKSKLEHTKEVKDARKAWKQLQIDKRISSGIPKKEAKLIADKLAEGILLSSESLLRTDGSEVSVAEILCNPDDWIDVNKFCCPIRRVQSRNVGKILGTDTHMILHVFSGGGVKYELKWEYQSLLNWAETCELDELEDWAAIHLANSTTTNIQATNIVKIVSDRLKIPKAAIEKDVKEKSEELETTIRTSDEISESSVNKQTYLEKTATHGDILDDFLSRQGDCRAFGEGLYTWEDGNTIWGHQTSATILKKIRQDYNHVTKCAKGGDYKVITRLIVEDEGVRVSRWEETPGFPCSDAFYIIEDGDVHPIEYSKDLNCRFKMGLKPDNRKTPYFDKILTNVQNPVLYQQLFGLALGGYLPQTQRAFIMHGEGGTGKGTTEEILAAMLPKKRLTALSLEQMNDPTYIIQLADALMNFTSEVKYKRAAALAGAKTAIGQGLLAGRALFRDPIYFYANCSFIISFNRVFPLESIGTDIERRFGHTIVKFEKSADQVQIDNLADIIIENELPGVLYWAMEGVRLYFEHGLEDSLSMEIFNKWMLSVDPVTSFFNEYLTAGNRSTVARPEVWKRFSEFSEDSRYNVMTKGEFFDCFEKLREVQGTTKDHAGNIAYRGLQWKR